MKQKVLIWLAQPFYVWEYTAWRKITTIILIELFSITFKIFYQPELVQKPFSTHSMFYLGHGVLNVLVLVLLLFVFPKLFKGYFQENRRTIAREIVWIFSLFTCLIIAHAVLIVVESNMSMSDSILESLYVNLKIGIFPVAVLLFMASIRSLEIRLKDQEYYNSKYLDTSSRNKIIKITGESETLKITLGDLYFIKSSNNYSEIHYLRNDVLVKKFLRVPLSNVEKQLVSDFISRTHRSYIVNFLNVKKVSGNANRCYILLNKEDVRVPVSRNKRSEVLTHLESLPIQTVA